MITYLGIISAASLMATFADIVKKKKQLCMLFFLASAIILVLPLGLRGMGVDYTEYVKTYNNTVDKGWYLYWRQYTGRPEPLYALLNFVSFWIFRSYQGVNILCAVFSIGFTYAGIYKLRDKTNLGITIWCFGFLYYIFMYGLNRMMIAVALYTWAYQYYLRGKRNKYFIWCIIAGLIHYSGFLMIPFYYAMKWFENRENHKMLLKKIEAVSLVIIVFIMIYYLAPRIFGGFSWFARYKMYFYFHFDYRALNNNIMLFFLLPIILLFGKRLRRYLGQNENLLTMFYLGIMLAFISTLLPLHRLCYFIFPCGALLYGAVPHALVNVQSLRGYERRKWFTLFYLMGLIIMGSLWIYRLTVMDGLWAPYITPYIWGEF